MVERDDIPNEDQNGTRSGATLPGDRATGAGREWRGKLDTLREARKQRRRGVRGLREAGIGLAMAGAAAPLAHAIKKGQPDNLAPERSTDPRVSMAGGDVEDAVGRQWAAAQADRQRQDAISAAMIKYEIDQDLATAIYDISKEEGIDTEVAYGLVKTESTFRPRAVSHVGARGLTQVLPSTARWMMPEIKQASQLFQPETNLRVGFRYLRSLLDKYEGDTHRADDAADAWTRVIEFLSR